MKIFGPLALECLQPYARPRLQEGSEPGALAGEGVAEAPALGPGPGTAPEGLHKALLGKRVSKREGSEGGLVATKEFSPPFQLYSGLSHYFRSKIPRAPMSEWVISYSC